MSAESEESDLSIRLVNRWTWIALVGILGGMLGLLASQLVPPVYETASVLAVSVDYGRTKPLELIVEDRALDRVAALLTAKDTLEKMIVKLRSRYGENETWSSPQALRQHIRLDSKLAEWHLVGIAEKPSDAAAIANSWSSVAIEQLDAAMDHAWEAARLTPSALMVSCVRLSQGETSDSFWNCMASGRMIDTATLEALRSEIALSRGILPILAYEPVRDAEVPARPVAGSRGWLVFSAALAGMICGGMLAGMWPERQG